MTRYIKFTIMVGVFVGILTAKAYIGVQGDFPDDFVDVVAIQQDGKAIVAGHFSAGKIMRRNADGSLDSSFSATWATDGFNGTVSTLVVQPDQKILAGGNFSRFDISLAGYIARLHPDGSIDREFMKNTGVGFDDAVTSIQTMKDGKIWVGGRFNSFNGTPVPHLARLNPDGRLDSTFQGSEKLDKAVHVVFADETSGKVFVGGEFAERFVALTD